MPRICRMLWARKVRKDSELEDEVRFAIPGPGALSELIQSFKLYEPNSKDVVQGDSMDYTSVCRCRVVKQGKWMWQKLKWRGISDSDYVRRVRKSVARARPCEAQSPTSVYDGCWNNFYLTAKTFFTVSPAWYHTNLSGLPTLHNFPIFGHVFGYSRKTYLCDMNDSRNMGLPATSSR